MSAGSGRPCSICTHSERHEIDRQLLAGTSLRKVAANFGITHQSLARHRDAHVSKQVAQAVQRERQEADDEHGDSLLEEFRKNHQRALAIMSKAAGANDLRTALAAIREASRALELLGKLEGRIAPRTVNVLITAEFKQIQVTLLNALEPFPDAKWAVVEALQRIQ